MGKKACGSAFTAVSADSDGVPSPIGTATSRTMHSVGVDRHVGDGPAGSLALSSRWGRRTPIPMFISLTEVSCARRHYLPLLTRRLFLAHLDPYSTARRVRSCAPEQNSAFLLPSTPYDGCLVQSEWSHLSPWRHLPPLYCSQLNPPTSYCPFIHAEWRLLSATGVLALERPEAPHLVRAQGIDYRGTGLIPRGKSTNLCVHSAYYRRKVVLSSLHNLKAHCLAIYFFARCEPAHIHAHTYFQARAAQITRQPERQQKRKLKATPRWLWVLVWPTCAVKGSPTHASDRNGSSQRR